jgi:hypothetical protein
MQRSLCGSMGIVWVLVMCLALAVGMAAAPEPPARSEDGPKARARTEREQGFIQLFDGSGTAGWAIYLEDPVKGPIREDAFFVRDGVIDCKGYGFYWFRYEAREFSDFILRLEFQVEQGANSGVCVRTTREGAPPFTGFEVQILDDHGQPPTKNSTGSIYDVVTPMFNASKPAGEWNELEITCKGPLVKVVLNGLKVIDTDFSKLTEPIGKFKTPYAELPRSGYIALQDHWAPVARYRNIRIKPLDEPKPTSK